MDDHLYYKVLGYAESWLIPRFREEYKEHKFLCKCPSYKEMQDFCVALNAIAPYAGFDKVKPSDYVIDIDLEWEMEKEKLK